MTAAGRLFVVLACGAAALPAAAQRPAAGNARVSGVVLTAEAQPAPVRRAVVTLGGDAWANRSTTTDDEGRFAFDGLPAGRYTLSAARPGFVTALYGARRPGRPGTPFVLGAGQALDGVRLRMARGAAITGLVRDQHGEPAPGVSIVVFRPHEELTPLMQVAPAFANRRPIVTDDRGMYRAFGLEPGDYFVVALPPITTYEQQAMTPAEIDAAFAALRDAARGAPPPATARGPARPEPSPRTYTHAPVFYPGTPARATALRLTLGAGEERAGVDFALTLQPTARIAGTVLGVDGQPAAGVQIYISGADTPFPFSRVGAPTLTGRPGPDGRFLYTSVTPGRYTLTVRTTGAAPGWASTEVTVAGADVEGVLLAMRPALVVSGRVEFDATARPAPQDVQGLRVTLQPPRGLGGGSVLNNTAYGRHFPVSGTARADGTFEVTGVLPGTYSVAVAVPAELGGSAWWLRSARLGGRDVLDDGLLMEATDAGDLVLTFTDRRSEISGTLVTPAGQPAVDYFVVVFSADRGHWTTESRRTKFMRPGADGAFSFPDLPGGDYRLAAVDDVDPAELGDTAFLDALLAASVAVRLEEGGRTRQDLKISGTTGADTATGMASGPRSPAAGRTGSLRTPPGAVRSPADTAHPQR